MGLFSKSKTYTDSSTTVLMDGSTDIMRDSILTSVVNDRPIAEDILGNTLYGLTSKASAMRNYAKDNYTRALPSGAIRTQGANPDIVKHQLTEILGQPVYIQYSFYQPTSPIYFAYTYLSTSDRQWNPDSGHIGNPPVVTPNGEQVYLEDALVAGTNLLTIRYQYQVAHYVPGHGEVEGHNSYETVIVTEDVAVPDLLPNEMYYNVGYFLLDDTLEITGNLAYWDYRESLHLYPILNVEEPRATASEFYPVFPIVENAVDMTTEDKRETDLYKTTKRALNIVGIKYQDLADNILHPEPDPDVPGSEDPPNPDDIDNTYIWVGADLQTENPHTLRYLHAFFKDAHNRQTYDASDYSAWQGDPTDNPPPYNTLTISEANFKVEVSWNYIYEDIIDLVLVDPARPNNPKGYTIGFTTREQDPSVRQQSNGFAYETSLVTFTKQISPTQCSRIQIKGLYHINYINHSHTIDTSVGDSLDRNDNGDLIPAFIIPVENAIARSLGTISYNTMLYDCFRVQYNSIKTVKLKWYQTSFFKFAIVVVQIVIAIYTMNPAELASAVATIGAGEVIADILTTIAINQLITIAVTSFVVDVLGIDNALLAAVVAVAVSYGVSVGTGTGFSSINPKATFVDTLMASTSAMAGSVTQEIQEQKQGEMDDYMKELAIASGVLEDAEEEMEFKFDRPMQLVDHQDPETFFARTLNPNPGTMAFDAQYNYVNTTLALPYTYPVQGLRIDI